jgi:hypothetical protein
MSIFSIFNKRPKQVQESVPTFNIIENMYQKNDFEVSEISFEEYQNTSTNE